MKLRHIGALVLLFALLSFNSCNNTGNNPEGVSLPPVGEYVVFAWNDLGMHCLNPTYDTAVILPPYNTVWVQVVKRGSPPEIVTAGLTVEYAIVDNTYSSGKRDYGQFWDYVLALFGVDLQVDTGLNLNNPNIHNGLAGTMVVDAEHFVADGIPVTPVDDSDTWNPYQVAEITVKNASGTIVAQTRATVPTSDEIDCSKCHGSSPFDDILQKHDTLHGTNLTNLTPVLCASCHASPALGNLNPGDGFLSEYIHDAHADRGATCYDCHPGAVTQCNRSLAHTAADGNCETCHGDMATVAGSITAGRIPWVEEPECATCHTNVPEVNTGDDLYRNATGHHGLSCPVCHGSPHAMMPSREASDNYQAVQYQGEALTIGSCGVCHSNSKGESGEINEFGEEHGGTNPEQATACNICHTSTPTTTANWPHSYGWHAR